MISTSTISKHYGDFAALSDVSVEVEPGSLTALLGPSGSGKSTLLRIIAGLEVPDGGSVTLRGRDVTRVPPQERGVGFVFQHYAAFKHMTVRDNVAFGLTIRRPSGRSRPGRLLRGKASGRSRPSRLLPARRPKHEIARRVDELLEIVGLSGYQGRYPSQLSGGQRQRMALARALAVEPEVLLLDEPFGALDATVRKELRAWLRRLHDEVHVTTIFVTHDQEEAMDISDQIVVMNAGRVEQVGAPRELYDEPANEFVMGFIGEVNRLGHELVRPHDFEILATPNGSTREAQIDRVVHLGFEVRVELTLGEGERIWVQTTRDRALELELEAGQIVFLRKDAARSFDSAEASGRL